VLEIHDRTSRKYLDRMAPPSTARGAQNEDFKSNPNPTLGVYERENEELKDPTTRLGFVPDALTPASRQP
jgi:hypothetical protein